MSLVQFPNRSPQPRPPNITVKQLAVAMMQPFFRQAAGLQDYKWPHQSPRQPFYGPARTMLRRLVAGTAGLEELGEVVATMQDELEVERVEAPGSYKFTQLTHNLRVLQGLAGFARLRDVAEGTPCRTQRSVVNGVEVRSTPDLMPMVKGKEKIVFLHLKDEPIDEAAARRTLELAHWVARLPIKRMRDFEWWDISNNQVLKWRAPRKTTVTQAEKHLVAVAGVWDSIALPKRLMVPGQDGLVATTR